MCTQGFEMGARMHHLGVREETTGYDACITNVNKEESVGERRDYTKVDSNFVHLLTGHGV